MNYEWAFLPMRPSNDLLGDPEALRARLEEDSYLYFEQVLRPRRIERLRRQVLQVLADHGWIRGGLALMQGMAVVEPVHEGEADFAPVYDDIQRLELFHAMAHDRDLLAIMRQVLGPSAFPHPLTVARIGFPEHYEVTTPPHQDWPNNQGTTNLTAAWIPLGDVPRQLGPIAVLRGSHRAGLLPLRRHPGPGNRQADLPLELLEQHRWVTTDFRAGDVLLFPSLTVHAALHNASEFNLRLSVDFRYQLEGEALTPLVLEPHFGRLTWDEIYAGWEGSDRLRYYWRDLDYEVVPFEALPVADPAADEGWTDDEWNEILEVDRKRQARYERRMARVAAHDAPDGADG